MVELMRDRHIKQIYWIYIEIYSNTLSENVYESYAIHKCGLNKDWKISGQAL